MSDSRALDLLLPQWDAPQRVRAAFSLRTGGVSAAPFDSLNLGVHVGDELQDVAENRRRLRAALALPAEPRWLEQVHGTEVLDADQLAADAIGGAPPPRADALITRRTGVVCCIQVADCLPVLLAARDGSAVGAAHAGWRGMAAGVIESSVRALKTPPNELVAWLGPCIGPTRFEVGDEVREAFVSHDKRSAQHFQRNSRDRWQCDLAALARMRLAALGVTAVTGAEWCTASDSTQFFSHRRDGRSGRMAALIWLELK